MSGSFLDLYFDPIRDLIEDPSVIEIAVNADGRLWVLRAGDTHMQLSGHDFEPESVTNLGRSIANHFEEPLHDSEPLLSAAVLQGDVTLRTQAVVAPASPRGTVLSFRLYRPRKMGEEPKHFDYLRGQTASLEDERREKVLELQKVAQNAEDPDEMLRRCIELRLNFIASGGTDTGKTELMRRLLWMIPPAERLVVVEDTPELMPAQPNVVSLVASPRAESNRTSSLLLQAAMRMHPDRFFMGELRGAEAVTFLSAINSGHTGSGSTVHADTARQAFNKVAMMILETGIRLNFAEILRYLNHSIDVVIQAGRHGSRRGILETYFPMLDPQDSGA